MALLCMLLAVGGGTHTGWLRAQNTLPDAPHPKLVVYQPGGKVVPPKLLYMVAPEFTEEARKERVQGVATCSLVVDASGKPQDVRVIRSVSAKVDPKYRAAARSMDDKAVEVVEQYRYRPGMLDGKPVAVAMQTDVQFALF